jgi:hypothetical protein
MATYSITSNVTEVNEGGSVVFTVSVTDGSTTTYGITIVSGTSTYANALDFSDVFGLYNTVTLPGGFLSGVTTFTKTLASNVTTPPEGPEFFVVQLRENNTSGAVLAVSQNITVIDTPVSTDPENGKIGFGSSNQPIFYFDSNWYKMTGTQIQLT